MAVAARGRCKRVNMDKSTRRKDETQLLWRCISRIRVFSAFGRTCISVYERGRACVDAACFREINVGVTEALDHLF